MQTIHWIFFCWDFSSSGQPFPLLCISLCWLQHSPCSWCFQNYSCTFWLEHPSYSIFLCIILLGWLLCLLFLHFTCQISFFPSLTFEHKLNLQRISSYSEYPTCSCLITPAPFCPQCCFAGWWSFAPGPCGVLHHLPAPHKHFGLSEPVISPCLCRIVWAVSFHLAWSHSPVTLWASPLPTCCTPSSQPLSSHIPWDQDFPEHLPSWLCPTLPSFPQRNFPTAGLQPVLVLTAAALQTPAPTFPCSVLLKCLRALRLHFVLINMIPGNKMENWQDK